MNDAQKNERQNGTEWAAPFLPADRQQATSPPAGRGQPVARRTVAWYIPLVGRLLMLGAALMVVGAMVIGLFGATVTASQPNVQTIIPVTTADPLIHIHSLSGAVSNIQVVANPPDEPASGQQITVNTTIEARHFSRYLAQRDLTALQPVIETNNGEISISLLGNADNSLAFFQQRASIVISVPAQSRLDLQMRIGSARVTGLNSEITADVVGGSLTLANTTVRGQSRFTVNGGWLGLSNATLQDRVNLEVNGGGMELAGSLTEGTQLGVVIHGGNADLQLPQSTAAKVQATANSGNLSVRGWPLGEITTTDLSSQNTANGYLSADHNTTSQITVLVEGGNVSIFPQARERPATPVAP